MSAFRAGEPSLCAACPFGIRTLRTALGRFQREAGPLAELLAALEGCSRAIFETCLDLRRPRIPSCLHRCPPSSSRTLGRLSDQTDGQVEPIAFPPPAPGGEYLIRKGPDLWIPGIGARENRPIFRSRSCRLQPMRRGVDFRRRSGMELPGAAFARGAFGPVAQPDSATVS
jgi:hypothetical protein